MEYKGYIGLFTFDEKLGLFQGRVSTLSDLWDLTQEGNKKNDPLIAHSMGF